jgi:hypothetical protein
MMKVIATVYGPAVRIDEAMPFQRKLTDLLEEVGLTPQEVFWRFDAAQLKETLSKEPLGTLVVGWGMTGTPRWNVFFENELRDIAVRQFLGLDLYERISSKGTALAIPRFSAGQFWGRKIKRGTLERFLDGHIVQPKVFYGLKRVEARKARRGGGLLPFTIELGNPDEIAIVRFIFDQFVNHNLSRTQICNMLNAQEIAPPGISKAWGHQNIGTILANDLYIGANRFKKCVKYDVFPAVIDKSLFFMAQAKLLEGRTGCS